MKALKALEKPLGFFLYPLKTLKKAIGKFLPNRWKRWKKPLGFFPLPVESAEKSRWENSSYLQRRELTVLFTVPIRSLQPVECDLNKKYEVQFSDGTGSSKEI